MGFYSKLRKLNKITKNLNKYFSFFVINFPIGGHFPQGVIFQKICNTYDGKIEFRKIQCKIKLNFAQILFEFSDFFSQPTPPTPQNSNKIYLFEKSFELNSISYQIPPFKSPIFLNLNLQSKLENHMSRIKLPMKNCIFGTKTIYPNKTFEFLPSLALHRAILQSIMAFFTLIRIITVMIHDQT